MATEDCKETVEYRQIADVIGYRFTSLGTAQSCWEGHGPASHLSENWRDLKLTPPAKKGRYIAICIKRNGKRIKTALHPLMCEAWYGPAPKGTECLHWDDNKLNNRPDNLRWGTRQQNHDDRQENGIQIRGEDTYQSKRYGMTEDKVREDRRDHWVNGVTQVALAAKRGVSFQTMHCIVHGHTWGHVVDYPETIAAMEKSSRWIRRPSQDGPSPQPPLA